MSHASSSKISKYDVFLSFKGEDTRRNIVSHLYNALEQRGIHTFLDDERLEAGKPIFDELSKAIEEARFAVIIFSKSYASSRWCLEELAHIIKCKNELEQIVIPVFYDVSPSEVRHQNPPFADSFSQHEVKYKEDMEKVQRWRDAFVEAGNLKGYHLLNFKNEADCIKKLVDDLSCSDIFPKSRQIISPFLESSVGMRSHVEKLISLLDMESNDVRSTGIWGMGGIGKTKNANVVYQRYRHRFEVDCFLGDVGELHKKKGLTWLQQEVICSEKFTVTSEHEGMNIFKKRLRSKKVLFTLDDVKIQEQLESLFGGSEWFGVGSKVIITARDKHLLISHVGVNEYEVQLLSEDEPLELFSRCAFKEKSPKKDFMELSRQVVKYAGGRPLAFKVLGSSFYRRDKKHWRRKIDRQISKKLSDLKHLDQVICEKLKKLPSFIQMEPLKELKLPEIKGDMHRLNILALNSTAIREAPSFIWQLKGLKSLSLEGCGDLVSLPDSLRNLKNLQHLPLKGCKKLEQFPENIVDLQELKILDASDTAISQPPSSITKLRKLRILSFSHDEPPFQHSSSFILHQLSGLCSLRELHLRNRNILGGLPDDLGSLHFLKELNDSGSNMSCLPKSINKPSQLHHLNVQFCRNLNELLGELPSNLKELFADYHLSLKSIRDLVICCLKLRRLSISDHRAVSSEQVNVFLQPFCRTCIQVFF